MVDELRLLELSPPLPPSLHLAPLPQEAAAVASVVAWAA